jgi:serine/threonine protein kinase
MPNPEVRRGFLLHLAAEGMIPVLGGCAGALAGGPEIGLVGVAVGQVVEKAINFFGARIVERWCRWFRDQPPEVRQAALADLAALTPEEARVEAAAALDKLAPDANPEDRSVALEYLSIIPGALDRALPRTPGGTLSLPPTATFDEPQLLLRLLPADMPPYPVPSDLPATPYRLLQLLGSGGFGAVYRATTHTLQHLPLAIKFCLDPALAAALHRERSNLERLMKAGGEGWSARIVRLYGYDLEHRTPFLVYEYVPGGDLTHYLARRVAQLGRPLNADEVLGLVVQVCEALAFAHTHGLVHRDLKPTNVLVDGDALKLADFGLGSLAAARAAQVSRIGATTIDFLTAADQASLFRGAGTPLYMAPEQKRGAAPDPRHDLYSLGVMWFQLLAGDVSRELHPGWAKELAARYRVPPAHLALLERCVGWLDERPKDAAELLPLLRGLQAGQAVPPLAILAEAPLTEPPALPARESGRMRQALMQSLIKRVEEGHRLLAVLDQKKHRPLVGSVVLGVLLVAMLMTGLGASWSTVALAVPLLGGLGVLLWHLHQSQVKAVQQQIQLAMRTLSEEFPEAVQSWGGGPALGNPETVREIVRSLPPLVRPAEVKAAPPGPVPPEERDRQGPLAEGLRQVAQDHAELARFGRRKPVPLPLALALSLFLLGVPVGLAAGACSYRYFGPYVEYSDREHYDYHGNPLTVAEYAVQSRRHMAVAIGAGVGTLLVLTAAGSWLLTRRPLYRARTALAVAASLLLALPAGAGAGGLWYIYFRPFYTGSHPVHNPGEVYDYHANPISSIDYFLLDKKVEAEAIAVGVAVCVLLVTLLAGLYLRGYGRRHAEASRRLAAHAHELAASFPVTVETWGGAKVLENREAVQQLLRTRDWRDERQA